MASKLPRLLDTPSKFALFSVSGLKDEKLMKKQTYMKTETYKLYSRVIWIFFPNFVKIDPYYFEQYRFNLGAFFETQCRLHFAIILQHTGPLWTDPWKWWKVGVFASHFGGWRKPEEETICCGLRHLMRGEVLRLSTEQCRIKWITAVHCAVKTIQVAYTSTDPQNTSVFAVS